MKKFSLILLLLSNCLSFIQAEKFQQAVVTDINYFLRSSFNVTPETFPFYFHQPAFIIDVQSDITKYIKERFKVDTVIFSRNNSINYSAGAFVPKDKARETAKTLHEKGTVYVAVETVLQLSTSVNGMNNYSFATHVVAYNRNGRKVFKFRNKIPFSTVRGDEIIGPVQMGEDDFYAFYFDGLKFAFEGKAKKVEKRFIQQPPTNRFDEFLSATEKFYLVPERKRYNYGQTMDNLQEVIVFTNNFWQSADTDFDIENLFEGNKVKDSYYLTNKLRKEDYSVTLKARDNTILNFLTVSSDVKIEIKSRNKEVLGNFTYYYDRLEGNFRGKSYKINWLPENQCAEVLAGDTLIMLINPLFNYKVIYIHQSVTEEQLGDALNLAFIFDFAAQVQQKLAEKTAEDVND